MSQRNQVNARAQQSDSHRGAGPFQDLQFEPGLRGGDVVQLDPLTVDTGTTPRVHEVEQYIQAFGLHADSVTIQPNSTNRDNEISALAMMDGFLGQHRLLAPGQQIPDGINVTVDHGGREAPYGTTKNTRSEFENSTGTQQGYDENAGTPTADDSVVTGVLELWTWEDDAPYFTFENTTGGPLTVDLTFVGYHYKLGEEINPANVDGEPIHVPVERIRGSA